jgi:hypothetical protein
MRRISLNAHFMFLLFAVFGVLSAASELSVCSSILASGWFASLLYRCRARRRKLCGALTMALVA